MKLVCQYMAIFFKFSPTSNHLHPLQVENCDSNSLLVVYEDDYGKLRLERVKECINIKIKKDKKRPRVPFEKSQNLTSKVDPARVKR